MMSYEEIKTALNAKEHKIVDVARETGLSYIQLLRLKSGDSKNPKFNTIAALTKYFESK